MLENTLNRVFRRKQYEFRKAFSEFSKSLTLIVDIDQLKDNVIAKIREIAHLDTILIFLLNPDLNRLEIAEALKISRKTLFNKMKEYDIL